MFPYISKIITPLEYAKGDTLYISEYIDFGLYDWVTYPTNAGLGELRVGRWFVFSHKVGKMMSYCILTVSGRIMSCVTVPRLTSSEMAT